MTTKKTATETAPKKIVETGKYVAFFDIMGFKDFVYRNNHKDVKKRLEIFTKFKEQVANLRKRDGDSPNPIGFEKISAATFSDSLLIVTDSNSSNELVCLITLMSNIFRNAFESQIPLKGALAYGEFTADFEESIFFGRPLIDAYELAEDLEFYGTAIHHTAESKIPIEDKQKWIESGDLLLTPIPIKQSGDVTHLIISLEKSSRNREYIESAVEAFRPLVSGRPRRYLDKTQKVYLKAFETHDHENA
jgi:hypothetical protein